MIYEFYDRCGQQWTLEMPEGGVGVLRPPVDPQLGAIDALGSEVLRLVAQSASLHVEFDKWEAMVAENRRLARELNDWKAERGRPKREDIAFLEQLADAAAVWEGTREAEDWVVLQRLIHQWNSMNQTESEGR